MRGVPQGYCGEAALEIERGRGGGIGVEVDLAEPGGGFFHERNSEGAAEPASAPTRPDIEMPEAADPRMAGIRVAADPTDPGERPAGRDAQEMLRWAVEAHCAGIPFLC